MPVVAIPGRQTPLAGRGAKNPACSREFRPAIHLPGRGVAVMLIRHPNSARGNDLYETPEVATLAQLTREPLPPTILEIEADALRMPEGRQ